MCGRENTKIADSDVYYVQISWAGGNGCGGNHNNDEQAKKPATDPDAKAYINKACEKYTRYPILPHSTPLPTGTRNTSNRP